MKIQSKYIPGGFFVEVELCAKSRKQFDKQARALRKFLRDSSPTLESTFSPAVRDIWIAGLDAIERLAYIPSKIIYVEPMAAAHAIHVVVSCILASKDEKAKAQLPVLFALASITPITMPSLELPQVPSAWDASPVSDEARALYEKVRDESTGPIIRLTQAYFLFGELSAHVHPEPSLQQLTAYLEGVSAMLRIAVQHANSANKKI